MDTELSVHISQDQRNYLIIFKKLIGFILINLIITKFIKCGKINMNQKNTSYFH